MMGGLDHEDYRAPMAEINTTPLVDVMLVLLVIFLVTAPLLTQAIKVELPEEAAGSTHDEQPVNFAIDAAGQYYWNATPLSEALLERQLQVTAAENPRRAIHLHADQRTAYARVGRFLAAAQRHGLTNIGFVTQPTDSSSAP